MGEDQAKLWSPFTVEQAFELFRAAPFPWALAGGRSIELALGHGLREHVDLDVFLLHADHLAVRSWLEAFDLWVADPPGTLRCWAPGEALAPSVHDVWCREAASQNWQLQLMFDGSEGSTWISRRSDEVRAPLVEILRHSSEGLPYLAPHVQLFYKAKSPRPKDETDFEAVLRGEVGLDSEWLFHAIARTYGRNHPWLDRLQW